MEHPQDSDKKVVIAQEMALHRSEVLTEATVLQNLLHPDFIEFGASGTTWTLETIVDQLSREESTSISMSDLQCTSLSDDVMLVTYESFNGVGRSLRSSMWMRTERGWQMRFHQGTPTE